MSKSVLLSAWSIIAYIASTSGATAQIPQTSPAADGSPVQQDQAQPDGTKGTRPTNRQQTTNGTTPVPPNSDAAEDTEVRKNVADEDARDGKEAPGGDRALRRFEKPVRVQANNDILVTGSRLRGGDQTTRLTVIDSKEIRDRGVTSVEELIRTLPQNLATIGAITNNRGHGPLSNSTGPSGTNLVSGVGALGVSAANLGGVGAGNTLILVNGRRIAGAAGIEQGYANLNGIPLSAIERVEISNGGQAAIYGADALGGVINFILKKNYVGTTVSFSRQQTSSGARNTKGSLYSGYAWGSGNVSASVEYSASEPVENAKTGYTTNNYAPRYNGNPNYDKRTLSSGTQPGSVIVPATYDPVTFEIISPQSGLTVPSGFVGAPKVSDLIPIDQNSSRDYVAKYAGPSVRTASATLNFEQNITDKLQVFGTGLYTRSKNKQDNVLFGGLSVPLGAGQYYNPYAAFESPGQTYETTVYYYPSSEIADGSLSPGRIQNRTKNWNVNGGVRYDFGKIAKVELIYTKSESKTSGSGTQVGSLVSFEPDPTSPTGYSCYNFGLANNRIAAAQRAAYQAAFDRQCRALTSSDPSVAFDPWKSKASGGGSNISDFFFPEVVDQLGSTLDDVEGRVTGSVLKLPAGTVSYALGGEYARSGVQNVAVRDVTGEDPTTKRYAFFGEANIPIVGDKFTLPLVRRLLVNVAMRRDVTSSRGAIGTVDNVPIDQGGKIIYGKNSFGRNTPAFGVLWSPVNSLDLRAKFTQGFKAPPASQVYSVQGTQVSLSTITDDPYYKCTTDCLDSSGRSYAVQARFAPNPNLRPETSRQQIFSASWQPRNFLSGLNVVVTYNHNRIRNQYATISDLFRYLPYSDLIALRQFYPRDATGKITSVNNMRFNIIGSDYKSLTYEASYLIQTDLGTIQPKVVLVQNLVAKTVGLDRSISIDQRGRILGVDKYKLVGSLQWNSGPVSANVFVYHTPSYLNDYDAYYSGGQLQASDLVTKVKPFTTVDMSASWVVRKGLNLQLAGRNILKAAAPFTVVDNLPYDTARYNVEGRSVVFSAQLSF